MNPFERRPNEAFLSDNEIFWRAYLKLCELHDHDPQEKLPGLAKLMKTPFAQLKKRFTNYLAERAARTHSGTPTLH